MTSRVRSVAVALLVLAGAMLLVGATVIALRGGPTTSPPPPAAATGRSASGGSTLAPSQARAAPGGDAAGATGTAPPAAQGRLLPAQWPEIRPTTLTLDPGPDGSRAAVDPVAVVDGTLTLPDDPDRVGWWQGGARAGAPFGTVVLAGHLDSVEDPAGYLAGLAGLRPGDRVAVSAGDVRQTYRVSGNYLLPSADLSRRSDLFEQQRPHRMLLITCGGPYDDALGRYRDNRVVEAVPVRG